MSRTVDYESVEAARVWMVGVMACGGVLCDFGESYGTRRVPATLKAGGDAPPTEKMCGAVGG